MAPPLACAGVIADRPENKKEEENCTVDAEPAVGPVLLKIACLRSSRSWRRGQPDTGRALLELPGRLDRHVELEQGRAAGLECRVEGGRQRVHAGQALTPRAERAGQGREGA